MTNLFVVLTGGNPNGQYWYTASTPSGGSTYGTGSANVGAIGTVSTGGTNSHFSGQTIEDAGIRAGEIIAYRAWILRPGLSLNSIAHEYRWTPKGVEHESHVEPYWGRGIYAFKSLELVKQEYNTSIILNTLVYGEVALWGEVIEHDFGYRAEYAKIIRITEVNNDTKGFVRRLFVGSLLKRLRQKYV